MSTGGAAGVAVGIGVTELVAEGVTNNGALGVTVGVGVVDAVRVGEGVGVRVETGEVDGAGVSAACAAPPLNTTALDVTAINAVNANLFERRWGSITPSSPIKA